jgi:hypothetical protein
MSEELIGSVIGSLIVFGLVAWAIVAAFSLSWPQALVISWAFGRLVSAIEDSKN